MRRCDMPDREASELCQDVNSTEGSRKSRQGREAASDDTVTESEPKRTHSFEDVESANIGVCYPHFIFDPPCLLADPQVAP